MILKEQKITYAMRRDSLNNNIDEEDEPLKGMFWSGLLLVIVPLILGERVPMFTSLMLYICGIAQVWEGLK